MGRGVGQDPLDDAFGESACPLVVFLNYGDVAARPDIAPLAPVFRCFHVLYLTMHREVATLRYNCYVAQASQIVSAIKS